MTLQDVFAPGGWSVCDPSQGAGHSLEEDGGLQDTFEAGEEGGQGGEVRGRARVAFLQSEDYYFVPKPQLFVKVQIKYIRAVSEFNEFELPKPGFNWPLA